MSSYATPADLQAQGLPAAALANITTIQQQNAIDAASTVADGYLAGQFVLPLVAPYTLDLVQAVCNIAAYNLLTIRGYNPNGEGGSEAIAARYKNAIDWLTGVSAGRIHPQLTDSSAAAGSARLPVIITGVPKPKGIGVPGQTTRSPSTSTKRGW